MKLKSIGIFLFCILFTGCAYFSRTAVEETPASAYPAPDPEISEVLNVYRDSLEQVMGRRVATVKDTLRFGKPEGALSNLVADALRFRAAREIREFVHVGIIGEGSFRLFFEPGELTLGDVYEFMPYDNHLVIITMNGTAVKELIEQIAALGGAPISGVRFRIDDKGSATGILVNSEVIDLQKEYRIATSSWAADGGDQFPALWNAIDRMDLDLSVQDALVDHFRNQVVLTAITDGRIRK